MEISASIIAMNVASKTVQLVYHLTKAETDATGTYRAASLEDLADLDALLAQIGRQVSALPALKGAA